MANLSSIVQFLPEDVAAFERVFRTCTSTWKSATRPICCGSPSDERGADLGILQRDGLGAAEVEHVPYRTDRPRPRSPCRASTRARLPWERGGVAGCVRDLLGERFVGLHDESASPGNSRKRRRAQARGST